MRRRAGTGGFRRSARKVNPRNNMMPMRGGIRL